MKLFLLSKAGELTHVTSPRKAEKMMSDGWKLEALLYGWNMSVHYPAKETAEEARNG